MRRALFLSMILASQSLLLTGRAYGESTSPADPKPDLELSRTFQPPRYRIADPQARARIRAWFQRQTGDSSQVDFRGNVFQVNGDGFRRLIVDSAGTRGWRRGPRGETARQSARRHLEQVAGAPVEEDPTYAAADYIPDDFSLQTTPQWGLRNDGSLTGAVPGLDIGMAKVWEKFDGDDSLVIAVLDAGINFYHPDLQGRWFVNQAEAKGLPGVDDDHNGFVDDSTGWDFVDGDNRPLDSHGHGTFLSGVIAAKYDNALGIAGMLPRVKILPIRVLGTTGSGSSADIAAGMRYAARMGAKVINFSIGINSTAPDTALQNAFKVARDSGILIAAAAANDARNLDDSTQARAPSNYGYANVYMVASHNQGGALSVFSNYGAKRVDLAAPGENIVTTTIPAAVIQTRETFEAPLKRWSFTNPTGGFAVGSDTLEGAQSLKWVSGNTARAVWDSIDLRGRTGGVVSFMLDFKQAPLPDSLADWLYVQVQQVGASASNWTNVGIVTSAVTARTTVAFNIGMMDGKLMRLRFVTDFYPSSSSRSVHIDDVRIKYADEDPAHQANYTVTGGTSLAAPYMAGYLGLMRVASARTGVPLTRDKVLAGTTPDSFLTGKVATGGRLDAAKGLDFYLRTLPSLVAAEPDTVWAKGSNVHYTLSVKDSLGQPVSGYALSMGPTNAGGSLVSNLYSWTTGTQTGSFAARFRADKPPLVLRRQIRFAVGVSSGVLAGSGLSAPRLRVGNRAFLLPAFALQGGALSLRLEVYGADGRTVQSVTGDLVIPAGATRAEYKVEGLSGAARVGARAWLNGRALQPADR